MGLKPNTLDAPFKQVRYQSAMIDNMIDNKLIKLYDSELALRHSCCRSSRQDGSVSSGTWHG